MSGTVTPFTLFHTYIQTLRSQLPAIFDGDADGVHDARVATRRIREVLPLVAQGRKPCEDLGARFKKIGRSLGKVRDADVRIAMLSSLETRIPYAAPSLLIVRQGLERKRLNLVRKLIKGFERTDVDALLRGLGALHPRAHLFGDWNGTAAWRRQLQGTVSARSELARQAIAHTTGVYFPHRVHSARLALKKLRYALEVADRTKVGDARDALARLKKAQELLGDLHDRQTLVDDLQQGDAHSDHPAAVAEPLTIVVQLIEAEIRELHQGYLSRRDQLLETCRMPFFAPPARLAPAVTVSIAVLSAGYLVHRRLLGTAPTVVSEE